MTTPLRRLDTRDHGRDSAGMVYVYPVVSRRAGGVSVGINLNPNNACNWRCIYCQVPELTRGSAPPVDVVLLESELRAFLAEALHGDFMVRRVPAEARRLVDIALSGNGEPTSARELREVVDCIVRVRADMGLDALPLRLITNGSLVGSRRVQAALRALGEAGGEVWFKVDAGRTEDYARINSVAMTPEQVSRRLALCARLCPTWVQSCFFALDGSGPDEEAIGAYLRVLQAAGGAQVLKGVLLYGLARPSMQPEGPRLAALPESALEAVAARIRQTGLSVRVSP